MAELDPTVASHTLVLLRSMDRKLDHVIETLGRHDVRLGRLGRDIGEAIRRARVIGNPGCYPTSVQLGYARLQVDGDLQLAESADLLFHLLVLLKSRGVSLTEVEDALAQRTGMSGLEEKAARKRD